MTEIIKKDTDYAMRMLVCLAQQNGNATPVSAKKLAASEGVPDDFAYKVLQKLKRAGLASGTMGSRGGFKLAKAPRDITLLDVLSAVQGTITVRKCCLARDACTRQGKCEVSIVLSGIQDNLNSSLQKITLADVLKERPDKKEE